MAARGFLPCSPLAFILRRRWAAKNWEGEKARRKVVRLLPGRAGQRPSRWAGQVWQISWSKSAWKLFLRWLGCTATVCPWGQAIFSGGRSLPIRVRNQLSSTCPAQALDRECRWELAPLGTAPKQDRPLARQSHRRCGVPPPPCVLQTRQAFYQRPVSSRLLGATCTWVINCSSFCGSHVSLRLTT